MMTGQGRGPAPPTLQRRNGRIRARLGAFGASVLVLHIVGWGLFLAYAPRYPALAGLGTLAYAFGLRHAFDADHLAAIDNTTRKLLQDGGAPLGVGFFFSLGHSTIVLTFVGVLALAARATHSAIPTLQTVGGEIGAGVSGAFLCAIGILNLLVLTEVVQICRHLRRGDHDAARLEQRLLDRGILSRVLIGRLCRRIRVSWQMYPVGLLFGLGLDTAAEVAVLAFAAGGATDHVPFPAVISLPLLFAAGMSLVDTIDGALMYRVYSWAFANPVRKVYYNITVTFLSVIVAFLVGSVELLQVAAAKMDGNGGIWESLAHVDLNKLGYGIVGLFAMVWLTSALVWHVGRVEERWTARTSD